MTFEPVAFLSNVKRIFSSYTGLSSYTWVCPTSITNSEITYPAIFIEMIGGNFDPYSTSKSYNKISFFIRFVIIENQNSSTSSIGTIFSKIIECMANNPNLTNNKGVATCWYFGPHEGMSIGFDLASTEVIGTISKNAMHIDIPCTIHDI